MKYHKINSVFKRDGKGRFTDEFSCKEYAMLLSASWMFYEKIDGTNIRIMYNPEKKEVEFRGRTDNAQIPPHLLKYLQTTITIEKLDALGIDKPFILYGEGFGHKIQNGGLYFPNEKGAVAIALFDIWINGVFLTKENVCDIAGKLDVDCVQFVAGGPLIDAIMVFKENKKIFSHYNPELLIEGVVGTPCYDLRTRTGERIITKLKYKDFKEAK